MLDLLSGNNHGTKCNEADQTDKNYNLYFVA